MWGKLFAKKFSPHPFQKLSYKGSNNKVVSARIDGRHEVKPRFCCRKRLGTTNPIR